MKVQEKKKKPPTEKEILNNFSHKTSKFKIFYSNIKEIICLDDDQEILNRIKFIYYAILFFNAQDQNLIFLSSCLKINKYSKEEIQQKENCFNRQLKLNLQKNNYKEVVLQYINTDFKNIYNNPFISTAIYYSFPNLIKQNILEKDKELYESFKEYLKHIYSSQLIKDIYYLSPEFKDFAYPFEDKEILNELFEFTSFFPFPHYNLMGFTQKEIPEIIIPVNLDKKNNYSNDFSDIVCQLSQTLNTCIHEQLKHYIKALIYYNSIQLGLNSRMNSDLFEINEERKLINQILKKNNHKYISISIDGGEKAEVLLYGNLLTKISLGQSLELFKKDNWVQTIPEHIENFIDSKKYKKQIVATNLEKINNNNLYCDFFKILAKKFLEFCEKKNENIIILNYNTSASKNKENDNEEENKEGSLILDYSRTITINRGSIRDASC